MKSNKKLTDIKLIEYELTTLIRRAVYLDQNKKIGKLDRALYLLLRHLEENGPANTKTLANEFKLDISTVSRQTTTLEALGFIQRQTDPKDRRVSFFHITVVGRKNLLEDINMRLSRYNKMLESWSESECEMFGELLIRLNESLVD